MPITYSIDKELGVIITVASGILTAKELMEHKRRLLADPDCRPGLKELSDVRGITSLDVSSDDVNLMSLQDSMSADRLQQNMLAIVVHDDLTFGMARMYQSLAERYIPQIKTFRDMSAARQWLGLPETEGHGAERSDLLDRKREC